MIDVDRVVLAKAQARAVGLGHHHDVAPRRAAVEILVFVDDRVELPFAAERHQPELSGTGPERRERRHLSARAGPEGVANVGSWKVRPGIWNSAFVAPIEAIGA